MLNILKLFMLLFNVYFYFLENVKGDVGSTYQMAHFK